MPDAVRSATTSHVLHKFSSPFWSRFATVLTVILVLLPPLIVCATVARHAVDVPTSAEWEVTIPVLLDSYEGRFSWASLTLIRVTEHVPVFPFLTSFVLDRLSGFDNRWKYWVNVLCSATILALFLSRLNRERKALGDWGFRMIAVLSSVVVFSFTQWSNFFLILLTHSFVNLFAIIGFILMNGRLPLTSRRFYGGFLCGVLATFSYAPGLAFWFVQGLLLWQLARRGLVEARWVHRWIWGAASVCLAYIAVKWVLSVDDVFNIYRFDFWNNLYHYPLFFLAFLGSPVIPTPLECDSANFSLYTLVAVTSTGFIVFLLAGYVLVRLYRRQRHESFSICAAFILYVMICAGLGSVARAGIGEGVVRALYALESRYIIITNTLWLGVLLGLFCVANMDRRKWVMATTRVLCLIAIPAVAYASFGGYRASLWLCDNLAQGRDALRKGDIDTAALKLWITYVTPDTLRYIDGLKQHQLSVFRDAFSGSAAGLAPSPAQANPPATPTQ